MAESTIDARDLAKDIEIVVNMKHVHQFKLRLWLAAKLIWLAQIISWVDFTIEQCSNCLEDAIKEIGDKGIVISIAYGPIKGKDNRWSVDCLNNKTRDSFERPYAANSLDHCLEIANIEVRRRGWLEEKSEV